MDSNKIYFHLERKDGRKTNEIRNLKVRLNCIPSSQGSLFFEIGSNKNLISIFGPINKIEKKNAKNQINLCLFRIQILSINSNFDNNQFFSIINRITEEIITTQFIRCTFYNIVIRNLENDGNFLSPIINSLSLTFLISGLPTKNSIGCCSSGFLNGKLYTDLSFDELFFSSASIIIALQNDCENRLLFLETKSVLNFLIFEKSLQNAINGCLQFQILKFSLNRYFLFVI